MNRQFFKKSLHGKDANIDTAIVFNGLDWQQAGKKPAGFPHTVWELLFHMNYWQDFMLDLSAGKISTSQNPDEESWPAVPSPDSEGEWDSAVAHFLEGVQKAEQEAEKDLSERVAEGKEETRADCLQTIVLHNTYHAGQVVFARKILGDWPPPTDGDS